MKLRVLETSRGPRLHVEVDGGLADAGDLVLAAGHDWPSTVHDAGALFAHGRGVLRQLEDALGRRQPQGPDLIEPPVTSLPPVLQPSKIICVGLNYARHAAESGSTIPEQPLLFSKFPSALTGHGMPVHKPTITEGLDYEGELAVVIGERARGVREAQAHDVIGGYTIINDVSARDLQIREPQWIRAKALDSFAPLGPTLVTADEVPDVGELRLTTKVNGELRQNSLCSDMIFSVERIISFICESITLQPGDVIATGTPAGVAFGMRPPRYLQAGDVVEVTITGIGTLRSPVVEGGD